MKISLTVDMYDGAPIFVFLEVEELLRINPNVFTGR